MKHHLKKPLVTFIVAALGSVTITSCSSSASNKTKQEYSPLTASNAYLIHEREVFQLSRQDIINATHECQEAGLRAVTTTAKRKIGNTYVDVPVDVTCAPKFRIGNM